MSERNKSEKINHSTEEWFKIEVDRNIIDISWLLEDNFYIIVFFSHKPV